VCRLSVRHTVFRIPPGVQEAATGFFSLPVELGNSVLVSPTYVGRENASGRDGGRRRRSQRPGCHGLDRVKDRQGTPVKKGSKRMERGKQMTVLWDWCASPSATANLPFRSPQANWKAECDESRPLRLEGGKDCKVLPILTDWEDVSQGNAP
jgi:hypothetical protein